MPAKKSLKYNVPRDYVEMMHYYGVFETHIGPISFWCNNYVIRGNLITIHNVMLDVSRAHTQDFKKLFDDIYYDKIELFSSHVIFFPFVPYKYRKEAKDGSKKG